jgi:hypothetical protein
LESLQTRRSKTTGLTLSFLTVALLVIAIATIESQITLYLAIGVGVTLFSINGSISSHATTRPAKLGGRWLLHATAAVVAYLLTTKI